MRLNEVMAAEQVGFPLLSVLIALPLLVCAALYLVRGNRAVTTLAIVGAALEVSLAAFLVLRFNAGVADIQFVERSASVLGVNWHLGVDGISLLFIPLTALLGL
ncbi:MAG: oxidoreductase, partial [Chloroflexota bacterium]|nr:oxidoreductase [Chloroflexota bacterium]